MFKNKKKIYSYIKSNFVFLYYVYKFANLVLILNTWLKRKPIDDILYY